MSINGAGIGLVCSLFTRKKKFPDSSVVQIPYFAKSSYELLCVILNCKGLGNPKLSTGLSPMCKDMYSADITVMQPHCQLFDCQLSAPNGEEEAVILILLWWKACLAFLSDLVEGCSQQPPFPGLMVKLPWEGKGWEASRSGKICARREGVKHLLVP